jgi:hypothetical protein
MSLVLTMVLLAAAVVLGAACGWMGARAPDLRRGPRMAPYRFLMILAAAVALMLLVHLANLMGLQTGRP